MDAVHLHQSSSWSSLGRAFMRRSDKSYGSDGNLAAIYSSRRSIPATVIGRIDVTDAQVSPTPPTADALRRAPVLGKPAAENSPPSAVSAGPLPQPQPQPQPQLPAACCDEPHDTEMVRGATYLADRVKIACKEGTQLSLMASHLVELQDAEHVPGATTALLEAGAVALPDWARFVFSIYFMNPTPPRASILGSAEAPRPHALLVHFASSVLPTEATGPEARLLQELWCGDALTALSRFKVITRLHNGPKVLRTALSWARMDASRPMLANKQVNSSLHRASLAHPTTREPLQHVEVAYDVAGNWLAAGVYKSAFSAVTSVDVSLTFVLEGRSSDELPERPLASVTFRNLDPSSCAWKPHPAWPASTSAVPGKSFAATPREVSAAIKHGPPNR